MSADQVLSRLEKVRANGRDKWLACCPAHNDKSPSLAIKSTPDEAVLLHCFAGCGVDEIVAAVGLELSDLFPPKPVDAGPRPARRHFNANDALNYAASESLVAACAASSIADGSGSESNLARLWTAAGRLTAVVEAIHGR